MERCPESYLCCITQEIMTDPVVDHEGNTYERSAIVEWLRNHDTSPITRNPLDISQLIPNRALKSLIEDYIAAQIRVPNMDNISPIVRAVDVRAESDFQSGSLVLNVRAPGPKKSVDICCVIDVSGSMQSIAVPESANESGAPFTRLDLVKHAMKTIINGLSDQDRLAIVTFDTSSRTLFELTMLNNIGKARAIREVEALGEGGSTNLWDGIREGLDVLRKKQNDSEERNQVIFLLTDGEPTASYAPSRGYVEALKQYQRMNNYTPGAMHTFGFGYDLDSDLLFNLAKVCQGTYAFIPDGGFVGTIFINAVSNLCSTQEQNLEVSVEFQDTKITFQTGPIFSDCDRHFLLPIPAKRGQMLRLRFMRNNRVSDVEVPICENVQTVKEQKLREALISCILQISRFMTMNPREARELVGSTCNLAQSETYPYFQAIFQDLSGQVMEAISSEKSFRRWGRHYLLSLVMAHSFEQCNNFKDPGVQNYGGPTFREICDRIDDIFNTMPAPRPTGLSLNNNTRYNPSTVVSMSTYNDSSSVCIHENCDVHMADGKTKKVKDIVKGDLVLCPTGTSEVLCVVKSACKKERTRNLASFSGGLLITPYHPIRIANEWVFPHEHASVYEFETEGVYSFVLKDHHVMRINGVECICLGHGFIKSIASHPYFGTQAVINDLKLKKGWDQGLIIINPEDVIRDSTTGMICGFKV